MPKQRRLFSFRERVKTIINNYRLVKNQQLYKDSFKLLLKPLRRCSHSQSFYGGAEIFASDGAATKRDLNHYSLVPLPLPTLPLKPCKKI